LRQFQQYEKACTKREKAAFRQMITAARLAQVDDDGFRKAMRELD